MSRQSTRWIFTWNNYEDDVEDFLKSFHSLYCNYLVYGREVSTSGTPHFQGFFTLKKKASLTGLKKIISEIPHLEIAKKTSRAAAAYCMKGSQPHDDWVTNGTDSPLYGLDAVVVKHGVAPQETQGTRSDLSKLCDAIKDGVPMSDVADIDPATYVRNYKGLAAYAALKTQDHTPDGLRGLWYWGPPGTGKSRKARNENPGAYLKAQNKWFDGYSGEDCIILDDLDSNCLGHLLKIWTDRYPCTGEIKGGNVKLQHDKFIVTSNYSISKLWEGDDDMIAALKRRFTVVKFSDPLMLNNYC